MEREKRWRKDSKKGEILMISGEEQQYIKPVIGGTCVQVNERPGGEGWGEREREKQVQNIGGVRESEY